LAWGSQPHPVKIFCQEIQRWLWPTKSCHSKDEDEDDDDEDEDDDSSEPIPILTVSDK
jgi:hypothetical protein